MPGFYLEHDSSANPKSDVHRFRTALTLSTHDLNYRCEVPCTEPHLLLGWNKYPEYPLSYHCLAHAVLLIDGVVYDRPESEIVAFAQRVDCQPDRCGKFAAWLRQWLSSCDAECVVVYAERGSGKGLVIANDVLGRLPVYWSREENRLFIGRETKMISASLNDLRPDRLGVTETIQFGFPLGPRTLLAGISRLEPGSIITFSGRGDLRHDRYHRWRLDDRRTSARPSAGDFKQAADVFAEACRLRANRFPERPPVLLLSGGLDSRAVAGGLARAGIPYRAIVFHGTDGYTECERDVAARVADHLACPLEEIVLRRPLPWHRQWAIDVRDGMAFALLAYLHQVLSYLRQRWRSEALVFTGDGGGQVMPLHRLCRREELPGNLTTALLSRTSWFDSGIACSLTGLSRGQFIQSMDAHIAGYPEKTPAEKYMRFVVFERGFKWLVEGEDRLRSHMWMTTPFYARPFFETAMSVPYAWKRSNAWFRDFLHELSPKLSEIVYANTGALPGTIAPRRGDTLKRAFELFPKADLWLRDLQRHRNLHRVVADETWRPGSAECCASSHLAQSAFDFEFLSPLMAKPLNARLYWQLASLLWYFHRTDQVRSFIRGTNATPQTRLQEESTIPLQT